MPLTWALNKLSWLKVWSLAFLLNCIFDSRVVFVYGFDILSWWIYAKAYPTTTWIFEWGSLRIHCLCICGNLKRQYIKKNTSTVNSFRLMRALCDCWIIWHDNNLTFGAVRMRQKMLQKYVFYSFLKLLCQIAPDRRMAFFIRSNSIINVCFIFPWEKYWAVTLNAPNSICLAVSCSRIV